MAKTKDVFHLLQEKKTALKSELDTLKVQMNTVTLMQKQHIAKQKALAQFEKAWNKSLKKKTVKRKVKKAVKTEPVISGLKTENIIVKQKAKNSKEEQAA